MPEQLILDVTEAHFEGTVLQYVITADGTRYDAGVLAAFSPEDQMIIPGFDYPLVIGDVVRLAHSDKRPWRVRKGWYSSEGTPAVWGWYLESIPVGECRPFRQKDRMEVLLIEKNNPYVSSLEEHLSLGGGG